MKVFISWSGPRSHAMAVALYEWLPDVLQDLEPFVSSEDIQKGARWASQLATELEETHFGIICLTPENLTSPWLLFEAGALSKRLDTGMVAPLLLDLKKADVGLPLSSFQLTTFSPEEVTRLVKSLNAGMPRPISDQRVERQVSRAWQDLHANIMDIPVVDEPEGAAGQRTDRAMLEELLELVRDLGRRSAEGGRPSPRKLFFASGGSRPRSSSYWLNAAAELEDEAALNDAVDGEGQSSRPVLLRITGALAEDHRRRLQALVNSSRIPIGVVEGDQPDVIEFIVPER